MGSGTSVPSSIEIALNEGFTRAQIDEYMGVLHQHGKNTGLDNQFWLLCRAHPSLVSAAEDAEDSMLSPEEIEERKCKRCAKMRSAAEKHIKFLKGCSDREKEELRNQGDMEMYTEAAIIKREKLREDRQICRLLDLWWAAAFRFLAITISRVPLL